MSFSINLHFDHAGGLLMPWREDGLMTLAFPNASYVVGRDAWTRALNPHSRDRASFIPELQPLSNRRDALKLVDGEASDTLGNNTASTILMGIRQLPCW